MKHTEYSAVLWIYLAHVYSYVGGFLVLAKRGERMCAPTLLRVAMEAHANFEYCLLCGNAKSAIIEAYCRKWKLNNKISIAHELFGDAHCANANNNKVIIDAKLLQLDPGYTHKNDSRYCVNIEEKFKKIGANNQYCIDYSLWSGDVHSNQCDLQSYYLDGENTTLMLGVVADDLYYRMLKHINYILCESIRGLKKIDAV